METHVQVISRTASPALTRRVGSAPETVNQVDVEVIAVVECRCNEMEILGARTCSGHIRQREEVQQALRDRIDGQPGTLKIVSGNRLTGARIDKLHTYAGEVSATFGNCGHGREGIIGCATA